MLLKVSKTISKFSPISMYFVMFRLGLLDEAVQDALTAVNLNQVSENKFRDHYLNIKMIRVGEQKYDDLMIDGV